MFKSDKMHPHQVKGRIIFMSRYNDKDWDWKRNEDVRQRTHHLMRHLVPKYFPKDDGLSADKEMKNNGMRVSPTNPKGDGTPLQRI